MTQNLLSQLRKIDPYVFEHLIADLWEEMGFQTEVIQQSQDKGIDVRATNQLGQKHLIQVKRHGPNSVVDDPKIREYAGLYRLEDNIDDVYVVTTNGFTSQARDTADSVGVELVDDERLIELITQNDTDQILSGHLPKPESDSESASSADLLPPIVVDCFDMVNSKNTILQRVPSPKMTLEQVSPNVTSRMLTPATSKLWKICSLMLSRSIRTLAGGTPAMSKI